MTLIPFEGLDVLWLSRTTRKQPCINKIFHKSCVCNCVHVYVCVYTHALVHVYGYKFEGPVHAVFFLNHLRFLTQVSEPEAQIS